MNKLPVKLRNKLIQVQKTAIKQKELASDIDKILDEYGLKVDIFTANAGLGIDEQTEALTYLSYGEGDVETNIKEFEEIFLYHVNK